MSLEAIAARFWPKVERTDGCWNWTAVKTREGYGHLKVAGKPYFAHRLVFALQGHEIPAGLTVDHLCRNPGCVNPDHLELVTMRENVLRGVGPSAANAKKTHCLRGHEFSLENTRVLYGRTRRMRVCKTCHRETNRLWMRENGWRWPRR